MGRDGDDGGGECPPGVSVNDRRRTETSIISVSHQFSLMNPTPSSTQHTSEEGLHGQSGET